MEIFPGTMINPDARFGKPALRGGNSRGLATVVGAVSAGEEIAVVGEEAGFDGAQVQAALRYVPHLTCHGPPCANLFDHRPRRELSSTPCPTPADFAQSTAIT
ncbi:MAG TPA: hypothetical protein VG318_15310 [Actinomycetota bacterium]|nr:hypothetical protein [Actinomycetota bacterium]